MTIAAEGALVNHSVQFTGGQIDNQTDVGPSRQTPIMEWPLALTNGSSGGPQVTDACPRPGLYEIAKVTATKRVNLELAPIGSSINGAHL